MSEWKTYKLRDVVNILDYKRIPLSSRQREQRRGKYPYYGAQGIIDYIDDYIFDGTYLLVAEDGENLRSKKQHIAQLVSGKYWVNNHAHILESNGLCDIRYICYLLNVFDISGYITGSAQPKLNQANLLAIEISLPPLAEQKRIADILSAIDDKIELNRRINANLEQQAQALYKSWFVDFEFPNEEGKPYKSSGGKMQESELGLIPNHWHVGKLSDIADIIMGQSPIGTSYNDCANGVVFYQGRTEFGFRFPSIKLFTTAPTRYAEPMSVLLSVRAPVGDINIAAQKCCIGRGLASIKSKNNHNSFMYYCLNALKIQLEKYNGEGTVFGSINKKELENLKMSIPNDLIVANFNRIINRIDIQILNLSNEINNLSTLRDTLLPKLMSGEITV